MQTAKLAEQSLKLRDPCPLAKAPARSTRARGRWGKYQKYSQIKLTFFQDLKIIPVSERVLSAREAVSD